ncbi:MAG: hypothetical protein IJE26_01070 [Oscillospiraceae bacterium]|nr:hypothetical protein [Oscillospiraceae bacterium]
MESAPLSVIAAPPPETAGADAALVVQGQRRAAGGTEADVVAEIVEKCPNTTLYIQSLLPYNFEKCIYKTMNKQDKTMTIRRVNKGLKKMARKYDLKYIYLYDYFKGPGSLHMDGRFTKDGLHINKEAYKIWANALKKYVK